MTHQGDWDNHAAGRDPDFKKKLREAAEKHVEDLGVDGSGEALEEALKQKDLTFRSGCIGDTGYAAR